MVLGSTQNTSLLKIKEIGVKIAKIAKVAKVAKKVATM